MLGQRRRRWPNIKTTLGQRLEPGEQGARPDPCTRSKLVLCKADPRSCYLITPSEVTARSRRGLVFPAGEIVSRPDLLFRPGRWTVYGESVPEGTVRDDFTRA